MDISADFDQHDPTLTHENFYTDRAKDSGYMKAQEKGAKEAQKVADLSGESFWNIGFFEHQGRRDKLDPKGNLKNYTPSLFVLNTSTAERISNPRRYYHKKGIKNINMFARTTESDTSRFLSNDGDITNHAAALDNYDFFLRHNEEIRTNLARVMLAKLDLDQDHKKTLADLLSSKEWREASGEEVYRELKNRLRQRGAELNDRYVPIFKMLHKAQELDEQHKQFLAERLKVQEELYKERIKSKDPIGSIEGFDETQKRRTEALFTALSPLLKRNADLTIGEALEAIVEASKEKGAKEEDRERAKEANELYALLSAGGDMLYRNAKGYVEEIEAYGTLREQYIQNHAESMRRATRLAEQVAFKTKAYPVSILAALADRKYFVEHASDKEQKEIYDTLNKEIAKAVPEGVDPKAFTKAFTDKLKAHKEVYEHIYNPEKDDFNPQRKYMPFESVNMHDAAGNVMRDALYLTMMEFRDKNTYASLYDKQKEAELINVATDREINKLKPSLDEVNDLYNAIQIVEKNAVGELSQEEGEKLLNSPMFENNSVLNREDIQGLKEFNDSMAQTAKVLRSKELVGTPSEQELRNSIAEMHYLNYSKRIIGKMYDNKNDGLVNRAGKFIGRNFFQNNKALYDMQECMKAALNPATTVETIPSMSRNCMDKLRQAYEREEEMLNNVGAMKGWLAVSFVGFIHQLVPVLAKSRTDMLERMIDELNRKIAEDAKFVNNARDDYERIARMLNIQNGNGVMGNHIVAASHAGDVIDNIEKEHLALVAMRHDTNKTGTLTFENEYDLSRLPDGGDRAVRQIALLKEDLRDLVDEQKRLKEQTIENAERSGNVNIQNIKREIERTELDINLIVQRLEVSNLLTDQEAEALRQELEEKRRLLEEHNEALFFYAKDMEENRKIVEKIERGERELSQMRERLNDLISERKEEGDRQLAKNNRLRGRTEVEFEKAEGSDILLAMGTIGAIKKQIDERIIQTVQSGTAKKEEIEKLQRDREKAVAINNQLIRRALTDKELLAEGIAQSLRKRYNIALSPDELKRYIGKNGIDGNGVDLVLQNAQHLSHTDRLSIRSSLFDANIAIGELNKEGEVSGKNANSVSSLIDMLQSSDMFDEMKKHNDIYVATDNIGDGKVYLRSAEGELGYYIDHMDDLAKKIETAESEEEKAMYRSQLAKGIEFGEEYHGKGGIDFNEYRQIAIKQAHEANTLEQANRAMLHRGDEIRREV